MLWQWREIHIFIDFVFERMCIFTIVFVFVFVRMYLEANGIFTRIAEFIFPPLTCKFYKTYKCMMNNFYYKYLWMICFYLKCVKCAFLFFSGLYFELPFLGDSRRTEPCSVYLKWIYIRYIFLKCIYKLNLYFVTV